MILEQVDVGVFARALFQRGFHGPAGGVGGVHHPPMGVPPLAGQVKLMRAAVRFHFGERNPLIKQPVDAGFSLRHHQTYRVGITKAGPGIQCVLNVRFEGILGVQHGRDAALRIERV